MSDESSSSEISSSGDETLSESDSDVNECTGYNELAEFDEEELNNEQERSGNCPYTKLLLQINRPKFGDVTPMINSAIPFLIDGDSLMLSALNQRSYSLNSGGQFLHVVYYCERILDVLVQKGGNFIIVFFDVWKLVWDENWYLQTCRLSLYYHLKHNTSFTVYKFPTFYDTGLHDLIRSVKPRCVLLHLGTHVDVKRLNAKFGILLNETGAVKLFCGEILLFFHYGVSCVDVDEIRPSVSIISSFHLEISMKSNAIALCSLEKEIVEDYDRLLRQTVPCVIITDSFKNYEVRRALVIIAGREFLKAGNDVSSLRLILLCCAAQEVLTLDNRGCSNFKLDQKSAEKLQKTILDWHKQLYFVLDHIQKRRSFKWNNIGDLWQGTLFANICSMITNEITSGEDLGFFGESYEDLIQHVQRESDEHIAPYPIQPLNDIQWPKSAVLKEEPAEQVMMQPIQNALFEQFCGSMFEGVQWTNPKKVFAREQFQELRHWHNRKPISDECDHIRNNILEKPTSKYEMKRYDSQMAKHSRYMNIYGRNLEGREIVPETIICKQGDSSKSKAKAKKESNKVKDMKDKIQQDASKKRRDDELQSVKDLKSITKKNDDLGRQKIILNQVDKLLLKLSEKDALLQANFIKLRILSYICDSNKVTDHLPYVKQAFLMVREILQADCQLTEKQKKKISLLLYKFGFDEIARRNNLPVVQCDKLLKLNWIRYQLWHLGPDLEKGDSEVHDPDVGFTPDLWQTKFINAIRENESALVVAPTSSGKTFASYYCMKRVLQDTNDGIVVYVSPTKALVNQVAATVYHRFSKVKLRDGISVVGVFTRDFKTNALNSRVLVTVPQCLDILLLSPRRYSWVKNIRYVIFDEVHNFLGVEGLVWERCLLMIRCPFLALSATISEPEYFHNWLQQMENFKKHQDIASNSPRARGSYHVELVEHSVRHSDLIKYTYGKNGLRHFHPFCALDDYALDMHDGVPPTVTLSPNETLQLFDAMYSSTNSKDLPSDLHIRVYFKKHCSDGFIKRELVRNYEKELGRAFYDIYKNHKEASRKILQHLHVANPSEKYEGIQDLLNIMARRNMLPALVFSYNRNLVEELHKVSIESTSKKLNKYHTRTENISKRVRKIIAKEAQTMEKNKEKHRDEGAHKKGKVPLDNLWKSSGGNVNTFDTLVKCYGDKHQWRRDLPSLNILKDTSSKFKGVGYVDKYDVEFIENRLRKMGFRDGHRIIKGFQLGFAYHHGGLNNTIRSSVEMLFRLGVVKVVFATGTLALGIHMPCKSVVIFGDSQYLNSLEYHQMSGRAGRRGFDIEGNVIFINIDDKRRDRLITDKLPKMIGHYPISVTLVLRLLLLVNTVTDKNCVTEEATKVTLSRVLVLLQNSLIFRSKPDLLDQIKHFVGFATQLLLMQDIIGSDGTPLKLGGLATHLHYHEPANLAFVYLFRVGALRQLLNTGDDNQVQCSLIIVLSHLFARTRLHKTQINQKYKNSIVKLEPLPKVVKKALEQYNTEVKLIFNQYIRSISVSYTNRYGPDDTLPLSNIRIKPLYSFENVDDVTGTLSTQIKNLCPPKQACSAFIALSGHGDDDLFTQTAINNIRHQICPDINAIPILNLEMELNAYAADFYRHGIKNAIVNDNGLRGGQEFTLLKDFLLVLKTITLSLEELEPADEGDPIVRHFADVRDRFDKLFQKAFGINSRD